MEYLTFQLCVPYMDTYKEVDRVGECPCQSFSCIVRVIILNYNVL